MRIATVRLARLRVRRALRSALSSGSSSGSSSGASAAQPQARRAPISPTDFSPPEVAATADILPSCRLNSTCSRVPCPDRSQIERQHAVAAGEAGWTAIAASVPDAPSPVSGVRRRISAESGRRKWTPLNSCRFRQAGRCGCGGLALSSVSSVCSICSVFSVFSFFSLFSSFRSLGWRLRRIFFRGRLAPARAVSRPHRARLDFVRQKSNPPAPFHPGCGCRTGRLFSIRHAFRPCRPAPRSRRPSFPPYSKTARPPPPRIGP